MRTFFVPQNTGWSGGSSWFDTYKPLSPNPFTMGGNGSYPTLESAMEVNRHHRDQMKDPTIKYRVVKRTIHEEFFTMDDDVC